MQIEGNGRLVLEKDETERLLEMAHNMINAADLNGLKTQGFISICDTFVVDEVALLLNLVAEHANFIEWSKQYKKSRNNE